MNEPNTGIQNEVRERIDAMNLPDAQKHTLETFVIQGWKIMGRGANNSVDIWRRTEKGYEDAYIREDGTSRTA